MLQPYSSDKRKDNKGRPGPFETRSIDQLPHTAKQRPNSINLKKERKYVLGVFLFYFVVILNSCTTEHRRRIESRILNTIRGECTAACRSLRWHHAFVATASRCLLPKNPHHQPTKIAPARKKLGAKLENVELE